MTVLPRRLLARFLRRELSAEEAEEHDLDVMDPTAPAQIGVLLEAYDDEDAEFTEQDREDLKEALTVALNRGLGDIACKIVYALTGPLFEALPQPREEGEPRGPEQEPEEENPRAPVGARRRTTRRRRVSRRKTKTRHM